MPCCSQLLIPLLIHSIYLDRSKETHHLNSFYSGVLQQTKNTFLDSFLLEMSLGFSKSREPLTKWLSLIPHKTWMFQNIELNKKSVEFLLITNLTHFFNVFIYLFHFSTCFDQPSAHHQENQLYQYMIWYGMPVYRHTRQSPPQTNTYQRMYWYNWFSWWWSLGCSKHAEKWNK